MTTVAVKPIRPAARRRPGPARSPPRAPPGGRRRGRPPGAPPPGAPTAWWPSACCRKRLLAGLRLPRTGLATPRPRLPSRRCGPGRYAAGPGGRQRSGPLGGHLPVGLDRGPGAELLPAVQDHAVHDEEHAGQDRLAEQDPERVLGDQADQADRDRGQDDHPGQPLVPGRHPRVPSLPVPQRGEEPADDPDPVPPEVDEQGDRGGHMHAHDEGQVRRLGLGHVQVRGPAPADQRRDQHVVPQAGHGEQLGHALDQADHTSLEERQMRHVDLSARRIQKPVRDY